MVSRTSDNNLARTP